MNKKKTILIGIDGCDFRILKPLFEDGQLPTFSEILEKGVHGTLISTKPPNSLPAWTSIFTGVNPGKHGVIDFLIRDDKGFHIATGKRKVDTLWALLNRSGLRQIIVNDPITYPPEKLNGIMLTGFSTPPGSKNFIYPEELRDEIDKACGGYQPELDFDWKSLVSSDKNKGFNLITEFAKKDFKAAMYLAKNYEWDLLSITFTSTDRLQHFYFNDKHLIRSHYELLDNMINDIISLESDANIFLMSDHGFGPLNKCFYINTWLKEQELLSEKQSKLNIILSSLGLTYKRIVSLLLRIKIYPIIARITPQSVKTEIPMFKGELKTDYNQSSAFVNTTNGGLYINNYDIFSKIITRLKSCKINGETPIKNIHMRDEVWWGPYAKFAPDVILTPKYGYEISPRLAPSALEIPLKFGDIRTGTHRPEGIFMAYGPDIKENYKLDQYVQTWDLAPTLLHMMNLPISIYLDGRVLKEIFKKEQS